MLRYVGGRTIHQGVRRGFLLPGRRFLPLCFADREQHAPRIPSLSSPLTRSLHGAPSSTDLERLLHRMLQTDHLDDVEKIMEVMKQSGQRPSQEAMEGVIRTCLTRKQWALVVRYVQQLIQQGYRLSRELVNDMIEGYTQGNAEDLAIKTFYQAIQRGIAPDLRTMELVIHALRQTEQWEAVITLWPLFSQYQITPSALAFENLVLCYMKLQRPLEVIRVLSEMRSARVFLSPTLQLQLICHFTHAGLLVDAEKLLASMTEHAEAHSFVVQGYLRAGALEKAESLFQMMRVKKIGMSAEMIDAFLRYYTDEGYTEKVHEFLQHVPTVFTSKPELHQSLIEHWARNGNLAQAREFLHRLLNRVEIEESVRMKNILIDLHLLADEEEQAKHILGEMVKSTDPQQRPNTDSYNPFLRELLSGDPVLHSWEEVDAHMKLCAQQAIPPNEETFMLLIRRAIEVEDSRRADAYFTAMVKEHPHLNSLSAYQEIIRDYVLRRKKIPVAQMLVESLEARAIKQPTRELMNVIMEGHALLRQTVQVKQWYEKMKHMRIYPGRDTFNALISCYAREAMLPEAMKYKRMMKEHSIPANLATFNSLIWCAARVGDMGHAASFLEQMANLNITPSPTTHEYIIAGYYRKGQPEQAEEFAEELEYEFDLEKLKSRKYFE